VWCLQLSLSFCGAGIGSAGCRRVVDRHGKYVAEGLKILKDKGAYTNAQDKVSSTVFGMPGEAIKLDAASYVLSPEAIPQMIVNLVKKTNGGIK